MGGPHRRPARRPDPGAHGGGVGRAPVSDDGDRAAVRARPPMPAPLGPLLEDHVPSTTVEDARSLAHTYFGLDGTVEPLSGERDRNFRVVEPNGTSWVLK